MARRTVRFLVWLIAVLGVASGAVLARSGPAHAAACAWALAHLSAMVLLMATTPRDAIRWPRPVGEAIVLGGAPVLLYAATGAAAISVVLAAVLVALNHGSTRRPFLRAAPALGNPWHLVPSVWHPALWLVASRPPGSVVTWLVVAIVPAAQAASVLTRSPRRAVRRAGWCVWAVGACATVIASA